MRHSCLGFCRCCFDFFDAQGAERPCVDRWYFLLCPFSLSHIRLFGFFIWTRLDLCDLLLQGVSPRICLAGVVGVFPKLRLAAAVFPFVWGLHSAASVLVLDGVPVQAPGNMLVFPRSFCGSHSSDGCRIGIFPRSPIFRADIGIYERVNR